MRIKQRTPNGFTVLELFIVVIIVAILAAVALPKFVDAQKKSRNATVKVNMHTVQMAAEAFAHDNGGTYPATQPNGQDVFSSYFPGGNADPQKPKSGYAPKNPFTDQAGWSEFLTLKLKADTVSAEKELTPAAAGITGAVAGRIGYIGIVDQQTGKVSSYAIEGADSNGLAIAGDKPDTTLVLSNQQ